MNLGATALRRFEMRTDTRLRAQESRFRLEVAVLVVGDVEGGKAPPDRGSIENLVNDSMLARGSERIREEVGHMQNGRPRGARNEQPAGGREQRRPCFALELAPQRMRAQRERRVMDAFADRKPRDSGIAMRRAARMRRRKAVD